MNSSTPAAKPTRPPIGPMLKNAPMATPPSRSGPARPITRAASPNQPASRPITPDRKPRMKRINENTWSEFSRARARNDALYEQAPQGGLAKRNPPVFARRRDRLRYCALQATPTRLFKQHSTYCNYWKRFSVDKNNPALRPPKSYAYDFKGKFAEKIFSRFRQLSRSVGRCLHLTTPGGVLALFQKGTVTQSISCIGSGCYPIEGEPRAARSGCPENLR
jgi:hypothetical protein